MSVELTIKGIDTDRVKDLAGKARKAKEMGVARITMAIEGQAVKEVPKDTDNLMSTITSEITGAIGKVKAFAKTLRGDNYALFVHEGTGIYGPEKRPIIIKPVNKKALTIPAPAGAGMEAGGVLLRKRAVVKGMKARPFFKWAWEKVQPRAKDILRKIYERVFKGGVETE